MEPHDILAEQAVLGSVLIDPSAPLPPASDFYRLAHVAIAATLHGLREQRTPTTLITLIAALRETEADQWAATVPDAPQRLTGNLLDYVGGIDAVMALEAAVESAAHAGHYARIVSQEAAKRRVNRVLEQAKECISQGIALGRIVPRLMKALTKENTAHREATEMTDALTALAADIDSGRNADRIYLGVDALDEMLQGVRRKSVVAIGGAPATGKSALALSIAAHIAFQCGPIGLFSQEMRADECAERAAAQHLGRNVRAVTKDSKAVRDVAAAYAKVKLPIYDWRMSPSDWEAHCRALAASDPNACGCVLDYVQLMRRDGEKRNEAAAEHEFLQDVMPRAKGLAQELNWVVFVLAQLKSEFRAVGVEPTGESFRGPAILENVDKAVILWRQTEHDLFAKVVKNRQGPVGNVELAFHKESVSFTAPGRKPQRFVPNTGIAFDDVPL